VSGLVGQTATMNMKGAHVYYEKGKSYGDHSKSGHYTFLAHKLTSG